MHCTLNYCKDCPERNPIYQAKMQVRAYCPNIYTVTKGAEVGKANGLSMLLDAETFDYTFHLKASSV